MRREAGKLHSRLPGVAGGMEVTIRFVEFCQASQHEPSIAAIRTRFNVSRDTAYRWRRAYRAAHGLSAGHKQGAW